MPRVKSAGGNHCRPIVKGDPEQKGTAVYLLLVRAQLQRLGAAGKPTTNTDATTARLCHPTLLTAAARRGNISTSFLLPTLPTTAAQKTEIRPLRISLTFLPPTLPTLS